jgi:hypothetical protein
MQSRRSGLSPLAIVLPHPSLPHRRSSLLSLNSVNSPHTPRSCPSPCLPIYYPANRKSTDSWNSSNGPDEMDFDWKPEQVLLLSRVSPLSFFYRFVFLLFYEYRLWMHFLHTLSLLSMVPFPLLTSSIKLLVVSPKQRALLIGLILYAQRASNFWN